MKLREKINKAYRILTNEGVNAFFKAFKRYINPRLDPYRPDETRIVFDALKADKFNGLMIDVGAHFGDSFSPFAQSGWRVFAFEPDSKNREILNKAFDGFSNVVIDSRAVSNEIQEKAILFRSEESTGISGLSSFHPSHKPGEEVNVITLEYFFGEKGIEGQTIDFLKIDTEGFDLLILQGIPWSKISPRLILCEFEDSKTIPLGYTFHDLANYLVNQGYKLIVSEWHPIKRYGGPHDWRRFVSYPCKLEDPKAWGNILATKEDNLYVSLIQLCNEKL